MGHNHPVIDADPHFKIDKTTRAITDASGKQSVLMQGDHNSERYTFEIPRYIDGHDMSLCDLVEIHYVNTDSNKRTENKGIYIVDDLQVSETQPDEVVQFTWLISNAVTVNAGPLSFLIRFSCTEGGKTIYAWNTGINKDKSISLSMYNADTIQQERPDLIAHIEEAIKGKLDSKNRTPNKFLGTDGTGKVIDKDVNYSDVKNTPSKLPNPQKLTISGYATGTYDGSSAVTIQIPTPDIPSKVSQLQNDSNFANQTEVGNKVNEHNVNNQSHNDIRLLIKGLTDRLNTLMDSEDVDLDQLSEIVTYIKNNKSLIDGVTTNKLNVTDVVNNLTTNVTTKALSASMGVELKRLIDAIEIPDVAGQINTHNTSGTSHKDIRDEVAKKAGKSTTLSGYGITDGVTKSELSGHNTNSSAHNDIRELVAKLTERLNTVANSSDVSLDQLSEIVSYIKNNKSLIEQVTTNKLNVTDVVNNLTTNVESKALSAAMGVELKRLIDSIKTTDASAQISEHDKSKTAHADIRTDVTTLKEANAQLKEDLKSKLDKNQGAENNGKILGIGADGAIVPVEKPSGGSGSELIYQKMNQDWNKGMCATNGAPMSEVEGFYVWINMVKGDKYIVNGFADDSSFVTLQMEKGYNQPIWNYVKCQDGSSIVDYNKANVNIENLKIECIKDGILCVNSKIKKDLFKEVKVTLTEVVDMIPIKISQLQNDSKFINEDKFTQESNKIKELIPTKTSQLQNDSEFLEKSTAIEEIDKRVGLNKLQIHDVIYGITGSPMQIFKHSIMSSDMNLDVFVKMKNTFNYPRYLSINTLDEGDTVVDMSLTNNNNEMIDTKRITFKGKRPTNPSSRKNILFIGDSRTYSGDMVLEASRLLSGTNGEATAPQSFNLSNYHVVGRRKKKNIDPNVGYEGNSGWTARTYFLSGVKSLKLTVENAITLEIGSTYTYSASNGKRATLMIEEIDGNAITCIYPSWTSTSALPSSTSGTLTKASGNGDDNIAFTNYVEGKWSPFLVNGNIDFKRYIDKYCEGQLDCVCIWLGINDLIGIGGNTIKEIDFVINDFIIQHLKKAFDKLLEQYPNCKVLLASEVLPSQNGGLATSVEAQYSSLTKGMNYIIHRTNKAYIELASQYPNKCFYLDNNCQFDAINGYDSTEKQVNLRNPKKEQVGSNNVHPNKYGYWQHADSFVRGIINLI